MRKPLDQCRLQALKAKKHLVRHLFPVNYRGRVPALKPAFLWLVQSAIFALSGIGAFLLRFDLSVPTEYSRHLEYALPIWVGVKIAVFRFQRLDRGWWWFVSIHDVSKIVLGNVIASALSAVLIRVIAPVGFPRSIYFIDFLICSLATNGVRVCTRLMFDFMRASRQAQPGKRIVIYGAGTAGITLLREIRNNPNLLYTVCGFVDDNTKKHDMVFQGLTVLGSGSSLPTIVSRFRIDEVLIALPSATGLEMAAILRHCHDSGVRCRTIPALAEIIDGRGLASQIRDVDVADLLGRQPVLLDDGLITAKIEDRVVLVTGAAGSIGSELCRQSARFRPRAIIGYEVAETPLFHLEREMKALYPGIPFFPEIGSVQNYRRFCEVIERHQPSVIYHAAAYKHVPMMENNIIEAIENNVFGTYQVAIAAAEHGVADFVMISSDKAVRPTNVMGTTKRIAELVINSLQNGGTKFVSVRFGNVLGSNGSVIPLFKQQIAAGGPVTVTDSEMRRYFMTIPEAVQLVLQASAMGNGGEIFVLDMGQPVRILDLARNLILLSGLRPDEDIKIEFCGARPGEKLYEELSTDEEETVPTSHEKISVFTGPSQSIEKMMNYLDILRECCSSRDALRLVRALTEIVPEYNPSAHILDRIVEQAPKSQVAVS